MKLLGIFSEDFDVICQLESKYSVWQYGMTVAELIKKFRAVFARACVFLRLIPVLSYHFHLTSSDCFLPFTCSDLNFICIYLFPCGIQSIPISCILI
jgi:hypothetical protein